MATTVHTNYMETQTEDELERNAHFLAKTNNEAEDMTKALYCVDCKTHSKLSLRVGLAHQVGHFHVPSHYCLLDLQKQNLSGRQSSRNKQNAVQSVCVGCTVLGPELHTRAHLGNPGDGAGCLRSDGG